MLPKKNRVDKKGIELLFKKGSSIYSPNFTFKFIKINGNRKQISFIAPKNIAKLAVRRNSLRRKGYSALKKHLDQLPAGIISVFVFKKAEDNISILENEIKNILSKIN